MGCYASGIEMSAMITEFCTPQSGYLYTCVYLV